jgi:hypothetical protein
MSLKNIKSLDIWNSFHSNRHSLVVGWRGCFAIHKEKNLQTLAYLYDQFSFRLSQLQRNNEIHSFGMRVRCFIIKNKLNIFENNVVNI